jgi:hypothetical protein
MSREQNSRPISTLSTKPTPRGEAASTFFRFLPSLASPADISRVGRAPVTPFPRFPVQPAIRLGASKTLVASADPPTSADSGLLGSGSGSLSHQEKPVTCIRRWPSVTFQRLPAMQVLRKTSSGRPHFFATDRGYSRYLPVWLENNSHRVASVGRRGTFGTAIRCMCAVDVGNGSAQNLNSCVRGVALAIKTVSKGRDACNHYNTNGLQRLTTSATRAQTGEPALLHIPQAQNEPLLTRSLDSRGG